MAYKMGPLGDLHAASQPAHRQHRNGYCCSVPLQPRHWAVQHNNPHECSGRMPAGKAFSGSRVCNNMGVLKQPEIIGCSAVQVQIPRATVCRLCFQYTDHQRGQHADQQDKDNCFSITLPGRLDAEQEKKTQPNASGKPAQTIVQKQAKPLVLLQGKIRCLRVKKYIGNGLVPARVAVEKNNEQTQQSPGCPVVNSGWVFRQQIDLRARTVWPNYTSLIRTFFEKEKLADHQANVIC